MSKMIEILPRYWVSEKWIELTKKKLNQEKKGREKFKDFMNKFDKYLRE